MSRRPDRRTLLAALSAALASGGRGWTTESLAARSLADVLAPPGGPAMASAGGIARRGDGTVAVKLAGGRSFGPAGERPFGLDQPFRVASVSKMITTAGFLPLAMHAGLDLDGDASDHLGFRLRHPAYPQTAITPRMILSHTSALRNGRSYPVTLGHRLADAFTAGGRHYDEGAWFGPEAHAPGAWFAYADVNFALVAQMLERLSGQRFDLYMRRALFEPLGLDIGYNWSGVSPAKRARAAAGVRSQGGQWTPQVDATVPQAPQPALAHSPDAPNLTVADDHPGENGFVFAPHGGLRLSLSDMDRLAQVFAARGRWQGRQIIPRAALAAMETRTWTYDPAQPNGEPDDGLLQSYGLGCEAPLGRPGAGGDAFFGANDGDWRGHFGDAYGWITGLFWNLRDGRTLAYAINGMPETDRPRARNSSLTAPEEALVVEALG